MKNKVFFILICLCSIIAVGCDHKEAGNVKESAKEISDIFASKDMEKINNIIFGIDNLDMDNGKISTEENLNDFLGGILNCIFLCDKISVKKIRDDTIEYQIKAPDMENVFMDLLDNEQEFSEEELLNYFKNYIVETKSKKFSVSVSYYIQDDKVIIDYQSEDFINAITGGLVDAYKQLYVDAYEEFMKGKE